MVVEVQSKWWRRGVIDRGGGLAVVVVVLCGAVEDQRVPREPYSAKKKDLGSGLDQIQTKTRS